MSVDLGFETIGNATRTVFDNSIPVLTTDPWIIGKPYFGSWKHRFEILKSYIGIIHFNCGGEIFSVRLSNIKNEIIFEVPRPSLIQAIRYSIFDDLLIGNFMKTRLLNLDPLYPKFAPFVTKFYDNGRVKNFDELKDYYKYYKKNSGSSYLFFKDQTKRKLKEHYKGSILELFYYYSTRVYYHIFQK